MSAVTKHTIRARRVATNIWLSSDDSSTDNSLGEFVSRQLEYEVMPSEEAVGKAMLAEIESVAKAKSGDVVIILLGGRGAQALHRQLGKAAEGEELDWLLRRLQVFTQDALAPMRLENGLSFVRDFERLLGPDFFRKVKSFSCMRTDAPDLEIELTAYVEKLEALGGVDIFFLGLGPEAESASHLAYIKPGSGATIDDVAGLIPISQSILEHHIAKFKAGGCEVTSDDERECRNATHIMTLGPAAIMRARRIVQSVVDASTAPAKKECYRKVLTTTISDDPEARAKQLDENPGLWLRLHPNVKSLILQDVLN